MNIFIERSTAVIFHNIGMFIFHPSSSILVAREGGSVTVRSCFVNDAVTLLSAWAVTLVTLGVTVG